MKITYLSFLFIILTFSVFGTELAISTDIPSVISLKNAQSINTHYCAYQSGGLQDVASFQIDSNSSTGFTVTAQFGNSFGWSLDSTGATQGVNFNTFITAQLASTDELNYNGSTALNRVLPISWGEAEGSTALSFSNGSQTDIMTDWTVTVQAKWDASNGLTQGSYSQTLSVTIESGS